MELALDVAWRQWGELGVFAAGPAQASRTAADPEALLLFTLEVARHDPRLFDEVLDWLVVNEAAIGVTRLRALRRDEADERLVSAALAFVNSRKPRQRLNTSPARRGPVVPLFPEVPAPAALDPVFEEHGFARPAVSVSSKSVRPDFARPIAFGFRMRRLLGVNARAEVLSALLTIDAPRVTAQVLERGAGYSRQNVRQALNALFDAGVVVRTTVGSRQPYFAADRAAWAVVVGDLPRHRDWVQLLGAARLVVRWLLRPELDSLSPYMLASEARTLLEPLLDDLRFAGIGVDDVPVGRGAEYWVTFETILERLGAAIACT